jgi:hypothetical protein
MNEKDEVHHPHRRSYIITFDLPEKVKLFRTIGLKVPDANDPFFLETKEQTISLFEKIFPDTIIRGIEMNDLAADIISKAMSIQATHFQDAIIVSTCPEITNLRNGASFSLQINRIIDFQGNILGIGPRPGIESIESQINALAPYAKGRQVILVEDGSFTGKTLSYVVNLLKSKGIDVTAVVIGFVFQKAKDVIRQSFPGDIFDIEQVDNLIDWMPDHDFYPFIPNNGRVIGFRWQDEVMPIYSHSGLTFSVPYLAHFCPITDWASIPAKDCWQVSLFFLQKTYELFTAICNLNNRRDLTIGELSAILPKVSVPIQMDGGHLSTPDLKIKDYLWSLISEN